MMSTLITRTASDPGSTLDLNPPKDDFDAMLLHEDFPILLQLAAKTKRLRQQISEQMERPSRPFQILAKSAWKPDDILTTVARIHDAFLDQKNLASKICRGQYPAIDNILEEMMLTLQKENDAGEEWLTNQASLVDPSKKRGRAEASGSSNQTMISNKSVAVKYAKWQTDILMSWMIEHSDQPFPDQKNTEYLMQRTGLTQSQVVNWTTNVRKRNRKATCENGKKPHHFIDFLFLAQDRESRQQHKSSAVQQQSELSSRPAFAMGNSGSSSHTSPRLRSIRPYSHPPSVPSLSSAANGYHHTYRYQPSSHQVLESVHEISNMDLINLESINKTDDEWMAEFAEDWSECSNSNLSSYPNCHHQVASTDTSPVPTYTTNVKNGTVANEECTTAPYENINDEQFQNWAGEIEDLGL
jgi:hypothetical protein